MDQTDTVSVALAHVALRAFYPAKPPFPLLHIDSTWEFPALPAFRDAFTQEYGFELIFGGARRDEEKSRAKERIVSVRGSRHSWDPRQQRPELWSHAPHHDIALDDADRTRFAPDETPTMRSVRFRTLGCWPVTGAIVSEAEDLKSVVRETLTASASERQGRVSDSDAGGSLEQQKRQGYF